MRGLEGAWPHGASGFIGECAGACGCVPEAPTRVARRGSAGHPALLPTVRDDHIHQSAQTASVHPSREPIDQARVFPRVRQQFGRCHGGSAGPGFAQLGRPEQVRSSEGRGLVSGRGWRSGRRHGRPTRSRPRGRGRAGYPHRVSHGDWHHAAGQGDESGFQSLGTASQACASSPAERKLVGTWCDRNHKKISRDSSDRNCWKSNGEAVLGPSDRSPG